MAITSTSHETALHHLKTRGLLSLARDTSGVVTGFNVVELHHDETIGVMRRK